MRAGATVAALLVLIGLPSAAQPVEVPSGQEISYHDVIRDVRSTRGWSWRFRFVAPGIDREDGTVDFATAALDMDHLCQNYAIPRLPPMGPRPREIVITLMSDVVEFGETKPEITQFFEAYRVDGDTCVWEGF